LAGCGGPDQKTQGDEEEFRWIHGCGVRGSGILVEIQAYI
jgi:hypothetical protein